MKTIYLKRIALAAIAVGIAFGLAWALRAKPVAVDLVEVTRGPMSLTIDEEGKTRVKDVYTVSAPIPGKVLRIPLEPGDPVIKDKTVVAVIEPAAPSFLDARTRRQTQALVAAARASVELAMAELKQARSELHFAQREYDRASKLARSDTIPQRQLEKTRMDLERQKAVLARAEANLKLRQRELDSAAARLIEPDKLPIGASHSANGEDAQTACCVELKSPVTGRLLKRIHYSEKVVAAGTPLVKIGNTNDMEITVDLLSRDAVKIKPGDKAVVEGFGTGNKFMAVVRRIEPAAFTKISALGIEEQRVLVLLDIVNHTRDIAALGHEYRVFVRITIWHGADVLRIPISALFRHGSKWAVFVAADGKAQRRDVVIGHRNDRFAQITSGLKKGVRILVHPSDRIDDGTPIEVRTNAEN